jgi:cell wall-associated NlpC family hydrolase
MFPKILFPRLLFFCSIFLCCAMVSIAQVPTTRSRRVTTTKNQPTAKQRVIVEKNENKQDSSISTQFENSILLSSEEFSENSVAVEEEEPILNEVSPILITPSNPAEQNLLSEITRRIGSPYMFGAVGPNRFDCSGFVWSVFQSVGINFSRSSARSLWLELAPAREDEKYKFGTLVFFNNLGHVGIVADNNGFYHASRRVGVTYSPFSKYWLSRINGFRRIPLNSFGLEETEQQSANKSTSKKQI